MCNRFFNSSSKESSILEDKRAEEEACGLAKTFPDIPNVSQIFGGPSVRRGDTNEGLNNPTKGGCLGNTPVHWQRVNFHCAPTQQPENP